MACLLPPSEEFLLPFYLRQLDAACNRRYKLHHQPVGACQITITIDKKHNKLQERERLRPLFSCLDNY